MANPTDLRVDDLSYEGIRENLKNFLKSRDQFLDVNFDASGISILLDVLAYNTYYNSTYLNLASLESFLTTAQRRNSVVSLARNLNYTPRSTTSARVVGTLSAASTIEGPGYLDIPKNTRFDATINGETISFLTASPVSLFADSGVVYTKQNVELVQGNFVSEKYIYNVNDANQRFIISNPLVDTTTLTVRVLNSTTDSTTRIFNKVDNVVEVDEQTLAYFLEEVEDGKFEVFFGDDYIGKKLTNGNVIYLEYAVSAGKFGNDVSQFSYASTVDDVVSAEFVANEPSSGGDERESTDRVKFSAPKFYEAQNRTVTVEDYTALLLKQPNVDAVSVWGGEDNDPPSYGKVFVSAKPKLGLALTQTEKNILINSVIDPKKILTVTTEFVDPKYIYLVINATVNYNPNMTSLLKSSLEAIVINTIKQYSIDDISTFSKYFRYSKLSRLIDTSERSILNNLVNVTMKIETDVQLNARARYEINFSNPINSTTLGRPFNHPYAAGNQVSSNEFTYLGFTNCFLEDNNGIIRVYRKVGPNTIGVVNNVGTITYSTGKIVLTNFAPSAFADGSSTLKMTAIPSNKDILPLRNQIVTIRESDITVNIVDDNLISLVRR
jgi:hypothetical protein